MRLFFSLFFAGLFLSSCAFHSPEFRGSEGFKLEKMDGKEISFSAGAKVYNPNWFAVKLKKSGVDVYLEEQFMGKLFLDKKVKMKAKQESTLTVPLHLELEEGALLSLVRYSSKETVNIRITGKVKGGIWFFSKKVKVDETRQIPGKSLRPGGMMNLGM